jgi:hypothetical protein
LVATALIPAAWMLLQIVPVPGDSIAHPIWRSSSAALSAPVASHISILNAAFIVRTVERYDACAA